MNVISVPPLTTPNETEKIFYTFFFMYICQDFSKHLFASGDLDADYPVTSTPKGRKWE